MKSRSLSISLLTALAFGLAAPAVAQPGSPLPPPGGMAPGMPPLGTVDANGNYYGDARPDRPDMRPEWHGDRPDVPGPARPHIRPGYDEAGYQQDRTDWLAECRRNHGNGKRIGGAIIGGVVGGVVGNRVAGRGNRLIGTVAGAAVGAVAGGAIGDAADRRGAQDWCETYLERNTGWQGGPGYAPGGYSYGYAPVMVMVPVMMVPVGAGQRECTTTVVTEEYVTEVPQRHKVRRMIRPRMPIAAPDKRVRTN